MPGRCAKMYWKRVFYKNLPSSLLLGIMGLASLIFIVTINFSQFTACICRRMEINQSSK